MRNKCMHHLNWIKFTVEFGKKHAEMPPISNRLLKEGDLVAEVFFLAEEASHAAVFVFDWANGERARKRVRERSWAERGNVDR